MAQMERIKPCVRVIQRRVKQFLLRFQLEEIKHKTLLKTCVTFTHKKMVHQWLKANSKVERTIGNNGEMLHGLCVTVTQEERNSSTVKMSETQALIMCGSPMAYISISRPWQSTQHNYENGSAITRKWINSGLSTWRQGKNVKGTLYSNCTKRVE